MQSTRGQHLDNQPRLPSQVYVLLKLKIFSCAATQHVIMFFFCLFVCMSHPTYGYSYMNLSHTRPILTKCDHPKSIQANQNQTKLKQTKKDHTNITKIQASPSLSVCPIQSTYKLTFPNRTHELDQTKITINGFGMARRAAQLPYLFLSVYLFFQKFSLLRPEHGCSGY